ncbi:MAG: PspC domain-containing protein [Pseudomonadota bacterium]
MERVVTINLNGNPYQLDESAYDALRAYLDAAAKALGDNPDKAEIIGDLEQAIADKCAPYLSSAKTIVSAEEMGRILQEMGPVQGDEAAAAANAGGANQSKANESAAAPKKRIYRVADDAKIAGVCGGIGAYFNIDSNIIRLLFIILTIVTHGVFALVYVAMMFLIPSAVTSEEWAAAHGIPFNAQEVIDEAKRHYRDFTADGPPWSGAWKWRRREWKRAMRERARAYRRGWGGWAYPSAPPAPAPGPISAFGRLFGGLFAVVFAIVGAALTIAFVVSIISLATVHNVLGWTPPGDMPFWLAIVVLCVVFGVLNGLIHTLGGILSPSVYGGRYHDGGLGGLVVLAIVGWLLYTYVPEAHDWMVLSWMHIRMWFEQTFNVHPING